METRGGRKGRGGEGSLRSTIRSSRFTIQVYDLQLTVYDSQFTVHDTRYRKKRGDTETGRSWRHEEGGGR